MAISFNTTFKGLTVENAIASVKSLQLNAEHTEITFEVCVAASEEGEALYSEIYSCSYSADVGDVVSQAYAYLKTLDKFSRVMES